MGGRRGSASSKSARLWAQWYQEHEHEHARVVEVGDDAMGELEEGAEGECSPQNANEVRQYTIELWQRKWVNEYDRAQRREQRKADDGGAQASEAVDAVLVGQVEIIEAKRLDMERK